MRAQSPKARRNAAALAKLNDGICKGTSLPGPCSGRVVVHHIAQRSVRPDLVTEPSNVVCLCALHHQWVHDHEHLAHELGFLKHSWEVA